MIPGKLYYSPVYNTEIWGRIENYEGKHYLSDFISYVRSETVFMVIENIDCFCKVLDANGNIGYIRYNKGDSFKEVKE